MLEEESESSAEKGADQGEDNRKLGSVNRLQIFAERKNPPTRCRRRDDAGYAGDQRIRVGRRRRILIYSEVGCCLLFCTVDLLLPFANREGFCLPEEEQQIRDLRRESVTGEMTQSTPETGIFICRGV
ncbi:hypothetical protein AXF42_Ash003584 [Apostasia shenzhenica]|uniref:Uncharacterized protein n=1 Tax=Apostasia shenzhenica TaxID=1088818 RepID=A0A2I0BGJ8_9ASPA|nr:hypothetical protein AXF42_Ash003584 [Apostasia shenzhenica]